MDKSLGYKEYINECLKYIGTLDKNKYGFKLRRWSEDVPYWCIFFYEKRKEEISMIISYYPVDKDEATDMISLLNALVDSGVYTKITGRYFVGINDDSY